MKTKILFIILAFSVVLSTFVIPVSADTLNDTTFTQNVDSTSTSRFRYKLGVPYAPDSMRQLNNLTYLNLTQAASVVLSGPETIDYTFTAPAGTFGAVVYIASGSLISPSDTHNYKTGDTCFIKSGYIAVASDTCSLVSYRITLRKYIASAGGDTEVRWGAVVASTEQVNTTLNGVIKHEQMPLTFNQDVSTENLVLCLELIGRNTTTGGEIVVFQENTFVVSYGAGKDPNYPIYGGASGKDEFNNFGNAEQEVLDSQQAGINAGTGAMSSAGAGLNTLDSEVNLLAGTAVISAYLTRITGAVGLWPLVEISIALGLFASLLGLAGSIVTAKDSKFSSGSKSSKQSKSNRKGG